MKTFEELECWKKAAALRRRLSSLVKTFPAEEKFRLTDQLIRASRSVTANLAEGFGRYHIGSMFDIVATAEVPCTRS